MSPGDGDSPNSNPEAIAADQKQYEAVKERLVKAYAKKAHWENRICVIRREIETIINKINGHLSTVPKLDFEQFMPAEAPLTPVDYTTGRRSIKHISALQGSLDAAKMRINALLNENRKLKGKLCERGRDLSTQVSRLDMVIDDLVQIQKREQEYAKMDDTQLKSGTTNDCWEDEKDNAREFAEQENDVPDAPDVDMVIRENERDSPKSPAEEAKSPEQEAAQSPKENSSQSTVTVPPPLMLEPSVSAMERDTIAQ
ncbi:unnamed protein product [Agarophyton chilense]